MTTPELFSQRRRELGLSQAELARRMGTCSDSVSNWERGKTVPRATTLMQWARALGLKVSWEVRP